LIADERVGGALRSPKHCGERALFAARPNSAFLTSCGGLLNGLGEFLDLRSLLFLRRRDDQRQQMTQRIHVPMDFRTALSFVAAVDRSSSAFGSALDCPTVEDRGARFRRPVFGFSGQASEIVNEGFQDFRFDPPLGLLIDRPPRREVVRQPPPLSARSLQTKTDPGGSGFCRSGSLETDG
jgi:hypothetical protein